MYFNWIDFSVFWLWFFFHLLKTYIKEFIFAFRAYFLNTQIEREVFVLKTIIEKLSFPFEDINWCFTTCWWTFIIWVLFNAYYTYLRNDFTSSIALYLFLFTCFSYQSFLHVYQWIFTGHQCWFSFCLFIHCIFRIKRVKHHFAFIWK
jgi:hypothetical protein